MKISESKVISITDEVLRDLAEHSCYDSECPPGACYNGLWIPDLITHIEYLERCLEESKPSKIEEPLKPCPFCGDQPSTYRPDSTPDVFGHIAWQQINCLCDAGPCVVEKEWDEAVRVWNKRP